MKSNVVKCPLLQTSSDFRGVMMVLLQQELGVSQPRNIMCRTRKRSSWFVGRFFFATVDSWNKKACCQSGDGTTPTKSCGHNIVVAAHRPQILRDFCLCHLRYAAPRKYAKRFVAHVCAISVRRARWRRFVVRPSWWFAQVPWTGRVGFMFDTEATPPSRRALWQGRVPCALPWFSQVF